MRLVIQLLNILLKTVNAPPHPMVTTMKMNQDKRTQNVKLFVLKKLLMYLKATYIKR
tara:strand:+ start:527 stop:697 length:171 start_codon:yes stop_codon:yes gene_type:complete